jgi:hypothetical protein
MFQHFLENVVTFFNENAEPTFFWEELYQHFSRENVRFNIFAERLINIFHHFLLLFLPPSDRHRREGGGGMEAGRNFKL